MKIRAILTTVAALGLGVALSGCSIIADLTGQAQRDADAQVTAAGDLSAMSLRIGDCLISTELGNEFTEVPGVPCNEPHDAEVIYLFDMPDGPYDEDAINTAGQEECYRAMSEYVGPNWDTAMDGDLDFFWFTPSEDGWNAGDHEINCLVYTLSGELSLTSSAKGIAP